MATDVANEQTNRSDMLMPELEKEHYEEIKERNQEVARLLLEWEQAKGDASEAKKNYDEAVAKLRYIISRGPDKQAKLDFDQNNSTEWRDQTVESELGLTAKEIEKLAEAGIETIGQLEDLRGGDGLMSVRGIGRATADKIENHLLDWLSENRDQFGVVTEDATEDGDSNEDLGL